MTGPPLFIVSAPRQIPDGCHGLYSGIRQVNRYHMHDRYRPFRGYGTNHGSRYHIYALPGISLGSAQILALLSRRRPVGRPQHESGAGKWIKARTARIDITDDCLIVPWRDIAKRGTIISDKQIPWTPLNPCCRRSRRRDSCSCRDCSGRRGWMMDRRLRRVSVQ